MAIIRTMANQILIGRVGQTTYYSREGKQVARQSRNNSNFGPSASRSEAQMTRRVKWSNLVNFYKANLFWMPRAFENAGSGVTVYNKFMSVNVPLSSVNLSKSLATAGACVAEPIYVSQGQLPNIEVGTSYLNGFNTSIQVHEDSVSVYATVGDLSSAIVRLNPQFQDGDNIAFVCVQQIVDELGVPRVMTRYYEFTLDIYSDNDLLLVPVVRDGILRYSEDSYLNVYSQAAVFSFEAVAVIHTRKVQGVLKVSTQKLVLRSTETYEEYTSPQSRQEAIDSYGVDSGVPLDPGSGGSSRSAYFPVNIGPYTLPFDLDPGNTIEITAVSGYLPYENWVSGQAVGVVTVDGILIPLLYVGTAPGQADAFRFLVSGEYVSGTMRGSDMMVLTIPEEAGTSLGTLQAIRLYNVSRPV